jgi:hypothetical protein
MDMMNNTKKKDGKENTVVIEKNQFINRFFKLYNVHQNRLKVVNECTDLFQSYVGCYLSLDKLKSQSRIAIQNLLITYFKSNNALFYEHDYLSFGTVLASYQRVESDDINDWTDNNRRDTTNVSVNWLRKNVDKAAKICKGKSFNVSKDVKDIIESAVLTLDSDDTWLSETLKRQSIKSTIEFLRSLGITIITESKTDFSIKSLQWKQQDVNIDKTQMILNKQPIKSREGIKDILNAYLQKLGKSEHHSSSILPPPSLNLQVKSSNNPPPVNQVPIVSPQAHTASSTPSLLSVVSKEPVVQFDSFSVLSNHSKSSSTSTVKSSISDSSSESQKSFAGIMMNHLHKQTSDTILTYNFQKLGHTTDYGSLVNYLSEEMKAKMVEDIVRKNQEMILTVELVLRLLQYDNRFLRFFKDLEGGASHMKESLLSLYITPQMSSNDKSKMQMRLLKISRKLCREIGLNMILFVKSYLNNKREELLPFFEHNNDRLNSFLDKDVSEDLHKIISKEDELYLEFSRDPFFHHRDDLCHQIIANSQDFDNLQKVQLFLQGQQRTYPKEIQSSGKIILLAAQKYLSTSNPFYSINPIFSGQKSFVSKPLHLVAPVRIGELMMEKTRLHSVQSTLPLSVSSSTTSATTTNIVRETMNALIAKLEYMHEELKSTTTVLPPQLSDTGGLRAPAPYLLRREGNILDDGTYRGKTAPSAHKRSIQSSSTATEGKKKRQKLNNSSEADHMEFFEGEEFCNDEDIDEELSIMTNLSPNDEEELLKMVEKVLPRTNSLASNASRIGFIIRTMLKDEVSDILRTKTVFKIFLKPIIDIFGSSTVLSFIQDQHLKVHDVSNRQRTEILPLLESHLETPITEDISSSTEDHSSSTELSHSPRQLSNPPSGFLLTDNNTTFLLMDDDVQNISVNNSSSSSSSIIIELPQSPQRRSIIATKKSSFATENKSKTKWDVISFENDPPSSYSYQGLFTNNDVLPVNDSMRIFLDNMVCMDLSKRKNNNRRQIDAVWCETSYNIITDIHHHISISVRNGIVAALNMILFSLRQMMLRNILPTLVGNHFFPFLKELRNHVQLNTINFSSLWSIASDVMIIPASPDSSTGPLINSFEDNSFKTTCFMWLEKIYSNTNFRINYIAIDVESNTLGLKEFQKTVRDEINTKYFQLWSENFMSSSNSSSSLIVDDSILLVSIQCHHQNNLFFPLVIRLDTPAETKAENSSYKVRSVYKLVGVYYRSSDKVNVMLCLSALDDFGVEFKFEWNDKMAVTGNKDHQILELPSKFKDIINSTSNLHKCYTSKLVRHGKEYFAEGLFFVLSPNQQATFPAAAVEDTISQFVNVDYINQSGNHPIPVKSILKLREPMEWLDDEAINFFGNLCQVHFGTKKNVFFSTFVLFEFLRLWSDDAIENEVVLEKSSRCLNDIDVWEADTVLHFPLHIPGHWVYIFVLFGTKNIYFCDSLNIIGINITSNLLINVGPKLLRLLQYEHEKRINDGRLSTDNVFNLKEWNAIDFPVPHQKDGFNCGVFVIMNLYRMMKNVATNSPVETNHRKLFSSQEMVSIRKTLVDVCYRKAGLEELENFGI